MDIAVWSIVEVYINKITLWISVLEYDWTLERVIIAGNEIKFSRISASTNNPSGLNVLKTRWENSTFHPVLCNLWKPRRWDVYEVFVPFS